EEDHLITFLSDTDTDDLVIVQGGEKVHASRHVHLLSRQNGGPTPSIFPLSLLGRWETPGTERLEQPLNQKCAATKLIKRLDPCARGSAGKNVILLFFRLAERQVSIQYVH